MFNYLVYITFFDHTNFKIIYFLTPLTIIKLTFLLIFVLVFIIYVFWWVIASFYILMVFILNLNVCQYVIVIPVNKFSCSHLVDNHCNEWRQKAKSDLHWRGVKLTNFLTQDSYMIFSLFHIRWYFTLMSIA